MTKNKISLLSQIKCTEMRRVEDIAANKGSIWKDNECAQGSSDGLFCSIEIKDAIIPPWIICGVCALIGSKGRSFETRYEEPLLGDSSYIVKIELFVHMLSFGYEAFNK